MIFKKSVSGLLAWRYLRGKRMGNAIPLLSKISMLALAIGSMALVMILSVSNGFNNVIKNLYNTFYPELKITPIEGKFFSVNDEAWKKITAIPEVKMLSKVLEDNALLRTENDQLVVKVKGVDPHYFGVNPLKKYIVDGVDTLGGAQWPTAILGSHLAAIAGVDVYNVFSKLSLFYPNPKANFNALSPTSAFQNIILQPTGVFRVQDDFDSKYILTPIAYAEQLFNQKNKYSSIDLSLTKAADHQKVKTQIQNILGSKYLIQDRYEQNKTLYNIMNGEKWIVYAILLFVLVVASFNMVGALLLMVIEKRKDMAILRIMGMSNLKIQSIFLKEGLLWAAIASIAGIAVGILICLGQAHFGWLKLQGAFIIDAYPVKILWTDIVLIFITVICVGGLASLIPSLKSTQHSELTLKS